jgi:hypothetical protein
VFPEQVNQHTCPSQSRSSPAAIGAIGGVEMRIDVHKSDCRSAPIALRIGYVME